MTILKNTTDMPTHGQLLRSQAGDQPDSAFLLIDDERRTYGDFLNQAEALAKGMLADGLRPGDKIGILMPNCIEFLLVYYAAQLAGAVATPINARYKTAELAHVIAYSDIRMLFITNRIDAHVNFASLLIETLPELHNANGATHLELTSAPDLKTIVHFGSGNPAQFRSAVDLIEMGIAIDDATLDEIVAAGRIDDIALMLFTSGTTAMPKACLLSHRNLYQNWVIAYPEIVGLKPKQTIWCPLPCFHIGGVGLALAALSRGACFSSSTHHHPSRALQFVRKHQPEHLYPGFFTLLMPMLREPDYTLDDLRAVVSIWMVAPYETHMQMKELLPPDVAVHQNFGITEGAGMVTLTRPYMPDEIRLKGNGSALSDCQVRVADPVTDKALEDHAEGEIQFRGPNAFRGYYKDDAATESAHAIGGWVKTGDWGRMDNGVLTFSGRIKDMLKVGGENVAAAEIEAFLGRHPSVNLAQVVGRPDDHYGEVPVAFIELRPGTTSSETELIEFCQGRLASFKVPRQIVFLETWPMSATKVQKFRLRELLAS